MLRYLVTASLLFCSLLAQATQTAQIRMYNVSVDLHSATDVYGDILSVNSTGTPAGDGELLPWGAPPLRELDSPPAILYTSVASLYDSLYDMNFSDSTFGLYLPELIDENSNGYPDFFEVAEGVNTNSYNGNYNFGSGIGNGAIWTSWLRSPGSARGTCTLYLPNYQSTFKHTFEIYEYTGSLAYTPGSNSVSGSVTLKQTGSPGNTLQGLVRFQKSPTDRFNLLTLQSGTLSDASLQTHYFTNHLFYRNLSWPTNYSGYLEFDNDGTQNTLYPYAFWVFSITDTHDANGNGVPDFSDDPQTVTPSLPRPPLLQASVSNTDLLLSISGDPGHLHTVQTAPQPQGTWQDWVSVTLTNDPQSVKIPMSSTNLFLRVFAQ